MPYSNLDVSEMFVDRQSQRSSMHARHLNEQLVRILKTIGYDVLRHRVSVTYEAEAEDITSEILLQRIFDTLKVP